MNLKMEVAMLRKIPDTMNTAAVARVDARLAEIGRDGVAIPLAIESGSRAWGFPSPDSDYDCRFVYVRPLDDYLSPWQRRDVIETPVEGELDVNGWDLAKAVRLLAAGNAVIVEWLMSPVIYRAEAQFLVEFSGLARRTADRHPIARHYLHLGERFRDECLCAAGPVPRKKITVAAFITSELEAAGEAFQKRGAAENRQARREAEAFFRATVRRLSGGI